MYIIHMYTVVSIYQPRIVDGFGFFNGDICHHQKQGYRPFMTGVLTSNSYSQSYITWNDDPLFSHQKQGFPSGG